MARYGKTNIVEVVYCPKCKDYQFLESCRCCSDYLGENDPHVECGYEEEGKP